MKIAIMLIYDYYFVKLDQKSQLLQCGSLSQNNSFLHFLVAFPPKIHQPLEFLLETQIKPGSPSTAVCALSTVTFRFRYTFMWNAVIHNNVAEEIYWVTNQVCNKVWDSPAAGLVLQLQHTETSQFNVYQTNLII